MPNFHTHWLVALQALDGLPRSYRYLKKGRKHYVVSAKALGKTVRARVSEVLKGGTREDADQLHEEIEQKVETWENKLRADHDAICFSAYMLGACGPDFWMLAVEPPGGVVPDFAKCHFDLGHYNRTHLQFEVSLKAVARRDDPQARVEKAYFLGMATHIAADLVLHQLVNVSAGAYNLLDETWSNEQTSPPVAQEHKEGRSRFARAGMRIGEVVGGGLPLWSTHNKVEHYWDTWVRHRWLGDLGKRVWPDGIDVDLNPVFQPVGLPLCDTIRLDLGLVEPVPGKVTAVRQDAKPEQPPPVALPEAERAAKERAEVRARIDAVLGRDETRLLLEKPLAFPWLFADAVLGGTYRPFIYSRVVDKAAGAYPGALVFAKANQEAESAQMDEPAPATASQKGKAAAPPPQGGGRSEKKKLQYFSTERNRGNGPPWSWNYLNYVVCPSLERLQKYGKDVFYDRNAFPPFVAAAARAARAFANDLANAYSSRSHRRLLRLGQFWNLDTGLGLRVESIKSPEQHQVITRIDWIHVLGPDGIAQAIAWDQADRPAYAARMDKAPQPYEPIHAWKDDAARAFTVYRKKFRTLAAIEEDPSVIKDRTYLDRISIDHPVEAKAKAPVLARIARITKQKPDAPDDQLEEALFMEESPVAAGAKAPVPTGKRFELPLVAVSHRLDLVVRASIARLGAGPGAVAMYLLGDDGEEVQPPADGDSKCAVSWLRKRSKILDRVVVPEASGHSRLATFSARLIVNLSADKTTVEARVVRPTTSKDGKALLWNDVVPWNLHRGHYGRNFAVATARKFTLRPKTKWAPYNFDPTQDFTCVEDLGLTEHCFFTLYPLVKLADGRWIDAFSKDEVTKKKFQDMKKISAINFVKIVLLYVIDGGGALQLRWCWQDGVRRSVPEVQA